MTSCSGTAFWPCRASDEWVSVLLWQSVTAVMQVHEGQPQLRLAFIAQGAKDNGCLAELTRGPKDSQLTLIARCVLTPLAHCCLTASSCPQVSLGAWHCWGQALYSCPSKVVSLLLLSHLSWPVVLHLFYQQCCSKKVFWPLGQPVYPSRTIARTAPTTSFCKWESTVGISSSSRPPLRVKEHPTCGRPSPGGHGLGGLHCCLVLRFQLGSRAACCALSGRPGSCKSWKLPMICTWLLSTAARLNSHQRLCPVAISHA